MSDGTPRRRSPVPSGYDLSDLGFDDEDGQPEPDTGAVATAIVKDQKTPGDNAKSFLALLGYMRKSHKSTTARIDKVERKVERYIAYAAGIAAAMGVAAVVIWKLIEALLPHH